MYKQGAFGDAVHALIIIGNDDFILAFKEKMKQEVSSWPVTINLNFSN
jgi:hypothetical protein